MKLATTNEKPVDEQSVLDPSLLESLAEGFKALGDPLRLKILHLLLRCGEMCACEAMLALEIPQSNLSFHMKTLRQAGLIKARKSGRWMYYSLNRPACERFLEALGEVFDLRKWPERSRCSACDETVEVHSPCNRRKQ